MTDSAANWGNERHTYSDYVQWSGDERREAAK